MKQQLFLAGVLAGLASASPAPQQLDFNKIAAAPTVASGPQVIDPNADGAETASLATSVTITGVATATANANKARSASSAYTPYYPALATSYTTDPALTATTTSGQACPTQPEAGTYCGFINPLDPCAPQPDGYGPVPTPDTPSAFLAYAPFHSQASAAPSSIASVNNTQYTQVFKDLNASVSAQSYLGLYTFQTYDVAGCAAYCDSVNLCTAFNIFIERDPSLNPSNNDSTAPTVWGYYCPNPPSMTSYKCTIWGSNIDASLATNSGQTREQFNIVVTGSDGYDKTNVTTPPDCSAPAQSGSTSISSTTAALSTSPTKPTTTSSTTLVQTTSPAKATTTSAGKTTTTAKATTTSAAVWNPFNPFQPWGPTTTSAAQWNPFNPFNPFQPWGASTTSSSSAAKPTTTSSWALTTAKPSPSTSPNPAWPQHPWGKPQKCGSNWINAPKFSIGGTFFAGPFNAQACANFAFLQSQANAKAGKAPCQMFNAFYLHKNGKPHGTYCSLYSQTLDPSVYANVGFSVSGSDRYECKQSWTYSLQAGVSFSV